MYGVSIKVNKSWVCRKGLILDIFIGRRNIKPLSLCIATIILRLHFQRINNLILENGSISWEYCDWVWMISYIAAVWCNVRCEWNPWSMRAYKNGIENQMMIMLMMIMIDPHTRTNICILVTWIPLWKPIQRVLDIRTTIIIVNPCACVSHWALLHDPNPIINTTPLDEH